MIWRVVEPLIVAGFVLLAVDLLRSRRRSPWRVQIRSSQLYNADYCEGWGDSVVAVRGEVAVRVESGGRFLTIGSLAVDAEQFEEELAELRALAEDRAATLNAHG